MKGLLVLGLGLVALAAASELTLQERVVDLVLEDFHKKLVRWVYKKQAVEDVTETEYPAGPFVRLRVRIQQTQCRNQPGSRQDCAFNRRGRKQICLACVKFDSRSGGKVLGSYTHCRMEKQQPEKEMEMRQEEECRTVQEMGEVRHRIGMYGFSKELPS
ncbi:retinoic acid receptor responder protein 2-like [Chrysemys picta bellii]|uniref:retinoic acid receptor responder protein 2-like n=1 Tax=Chrysemys picta bellii TaxID=8478 RepID=UPI0032B19DCD